MDRESLEAMQREEAVNTALANYGHRFGEAPPLWDIRTRGLDLLTVVRDALASGQPIKFDDEEEGVLT